MTSPFENFKKSLNASKSAQAAYTIFGSDLRVRAATALSGKIEAAYNRIYLFAEKHNILFVTVSNEGNVLHQSQSVMDALMFNGFTDAAMRIARRDRSGKAIPSFYRHIEGTSVGFMFPAFDPDLRNIIKVDEEGNIRPNDDAEAAIAVIDINAQAETRAIHEKDETVIASSDVSAIGARMGTLPNDLHLTVRQVEDFASDFSNVYMTLAKAAYESLSLVRALATDNTFYDFVHTMIIVMEASVLFNFLERPYAGFTHQEMWKSFVPHILENLAKSGKGKSKPSA